VEEGGVSYFTGIQCSSPLLVKPRGVERRKLLRDTQDGDKLILLQTSIADPVIPTLLKVNERNRHFCKALLFLTSFVWPV